MVRPGGYPPTRRSSWIASRGGVVGRAIAGRMRAGLVAEASAMAAPGPSTDPWCHGPPLGSGGSMHVGRMHGIHGRPRGPPVRRADRQPLWHCRRRVVQRGLEEGTREPWGPLGPGPCDPGRDSPDRVTMRSRASPLGDRPPDPRPSRHRMETTTQGSSPKPTINHCLKNPHHSRRRPGPGHGGRPRGRGRPRRSRWGTAGSVVARRPALRVVEVDGRQLADDDQ